MVKMELVTALVAVTKHRYYHQQRMKLMGQFNSHEEYRACCLAGITRLHLGQWLNIETHDLASAYVWQDAAYYNDFGEVIGQFAANTIYLNRHADRLQEDLFHEIGHAVARKFNLIGHCKNGFTGDWEIRQSRLISRVRHQRHWSRLLDRINLWAPAFTPDLGSEIWAELFMYWHLYPEREEILFIDPEMQSLQTQPEIKGVSDLAARLSTKARRQ
jgi:hypothetical protein